MPEQNGDWIYEFMPIGEADKLDEKMRKITANAKMNDDVVTMMMEATVDDCATLVEAWDRMNQVGDHVGFRVVMEFMTYVIEGLRRSMRGEV